MKSERIKELLPAVFQQAIVPGRPITAYLDVMEHLHTSVETRLDELDCYFDPRRAPEPFVRYLAAWVDVDFPVSTGRLRELVALFVELLATRGTRRGLVRLLEVATGLEGFEVHENAPDEDDDKKLPRPFQIEVSAPAAAKPHRRLLEALIERDKPAYVTSRLTFRSD